MTNYKIMIIEDDEVIAQSVKESLMRWDYSVQIIEDLKNVAKEVAEAEPHLILLDINLPFYNGFYWCKEIRTFSKVPVIFLSSVDDNMNIVMAMDMGGDDFISKPFDINVLTAKVNAMIRRSYSYMGNSNVLSVDDIILNLEDATLVYHGNQIELTKNEYKILRLLMENAGSMVSRDRIISKLWDGGDFIDDNTLTVNITRIRKKLKEIGIEEFIRTKKGIGYIV